MHLTHLIAIKLHEDVIPNLNKTIAILIRTAGGSPRYLWTMIIENFSARSTRACITHHPKIIRRITRPFVVANPNDALCRYANLF